MRQHARQFYLACFALLFSTTVCASECAIDPSSTVTDACTSYASLDSLNREIRPTLNDLTAADFFAYYRLNLYNKVCPFWSDENSICGNRACAVDTIEDEADIPLIWRAEELSKLEGARAQHPPRQLQKERPKKRPLQYQLGENVDESCVFEDDDECDERDYCVPEDEGAAGKGDYVSLLHNTERFTGYAGPGARQVWDAIYKENCFSSASSAPASDLRNVFQEYGRQHVEEDVAIDDQCIEQRAFHRIISGMHASISSHLCWDYFNQTTGEWVRNVQCYRERLHDHPERISNLYFNYALVTRAIAKLNKHLQSYTFCSGDVDQDRDTKAKVQLLTNRLAQVPNTFDESIMFQDPQMVELKDDFKQRFRNVSRIMDCVGCDKCRLWGKVQTAGYGAALKVLFEFDETKNGENPDLRRTELVALINTYARLSHSLQAIKHFRELVVEEPKPKTTAWMPKPSQIETVKEEVKKPSRNLDDLSAWEGAKLEVKLVWKTYLMVLDHWISLPFKFSRIFIMELSRLWNFWLGLPVSPRSWEVSWPEPPRRDEL